MRLVVVNNFSPPFPATKSEANLGDSLLWVVGQRLQQVRRAESGRRWTGPSMRRVVTEVSIYMLNTSACNIVRKVVEAWYGFALAPTRSRVQVLPRAMALNHVSNIQ